MSIFCLSELLESTIVNKLPIRYGEHNSGEFSQPEEIWISGLHYIPETSFSAWRLRQWPLIFYDTLWKESDMELVKLGELYNLTDGGVKSAR